MRPHPRTPLNPPLVLTAHLSGGANSALPDFWESKGRGKGTGRGKGKGRKVAGGKKGNGKKERGK